MRIYEMSLLLLSAGFFNSMHAGPSIIPTKEEQANLLTNVQEVLEQLKVLIDVEVNSTDVSVVNDINRVVQRAKDKLELVKELSSTKMSCSSNAVCMLESKQVIHKLSEEGDEAFKLCLKQTFDDVKTNSFSVRNSTESAVESGQNLLRTLLNCSRKSGLQVISCYKDVIATDVVPCKQLFLAALEAHKQGHLRAIEIRNTANDCVDDVLKKYQEEMAAVLNGALHCK